MSAVAIAMPAPQRLAEISADGQVSIDWDAVAACAAEPPDPLTRAIACALLAARDGTWKPLPREPAPSGAQVAQADHAA